MLTVPKSAVQHGPDGLYVYVVKPDATVARQDVTVDQETGHVSVIASGLSEGEKVVVSGQSRLQSGTRVAVNGAGETKPGATADTTRKSGG